MSIIVCPAPSGVKGIDTVAHISRKLALQFKSVGYSFFVRYLGSLTPAERDAIISTGLGLMAVGYSRRPGWIPTGPEGLSDGCLAVQHAAECEIPKGVSLWCDLEGPSDHCKTSDCIDYVNQWADVVQAEGYRAGLYVGYGVPLTPAELYHLAVTGYWHSCSKVQAVATRGYQMTQLSPGNRTICGTKVDVNIITVDGKGDTPHWMIDPDAALSGVTP